jgi:hypothetical protein
MTELSSYFKARRSKAGGSALLPRAFFGRAASAAFALSSAFYGAAIDPASALPSFARQTGQTCSACHTAFPQLTPFGRRFKLGGYTLEGGDTRNLPAVSFMIQSTFTHYNMGLNGPPGTTYAVPDPDGGFPNSNNFLDLAQQSSVFYGGKVWGNLGAFVQATYSNDYGRAFALDNTDIRYADTVKMNGVEVLYGLTVNNNPTVQDPWNTTPVWSNPFIQSSFALSPVASTMIESWTPSQVLGAGGYVFVNDMFYAELSGYGSLSSRIQNSLGVSPPQLGFTIDGVAPYYRVAMERNWGDHSLMVGAYGMSASIIPNNIWGFGVDHFYDTGIDAQYQWISDQHAVTLRGNFIYENQGLNSTYAQGNSANPNNYLKTLKLSAEYVYDHTYAVTGTYFNINGSPDAIIFGSNVNTSPNSAGFIFDIAYLPFSKGGPQIWPWFNTRLGMSYTMFTKFDGGASNIDPMGCWNCRNASDNNTFLVYAWTAF